MFSKFVSIGEFRTAVTNIKHSAKFICLKDEKPLYDENVEMPIVSFTGTVKAHGTNIGIGLNLKTKEKWYQSKKTLLP